VHGFLRHSQLLIVRCGPGGPRTPGPRFDEAETWSVGGGIGHDRPLVPSRPSVPALTVMRPRHPRSREAVVDPRGDVAVVRFAEVGLQDPPGNGASATASSATDRRCMSDVRQSVGRSNWHEARRRRTPAAQARSLDESGDPDVEQVG